MSLPVTQECYVTDSDRFLPHATVATVLENDGKFLLVEELARATSA